MEIIAVRIEGSLTQKAMDTLTTFVSDRRQIQISRYVRWEDRVRTLVGELMVRQFVTDQLNIENDNVQFEWNAYGKPFLKNIDLQFNISHSGDWVVGAFDHYPIGIDVEKIVPIDLGIAKRYFSEKEYQQLLHNIPRERIDCFFNYWTAKESYIKAIGKGLSIPLHSFYAIFNEEQIIYHSLLGNQEWCGKSYDIDPEYKLAVCSKNTLFPEQVIMRGEMDIYRYFSP